MAQRTVLSKQTEQVLVALLRPSAEWRHGYDLSRQTGLKSGTLYPILMRLEGLGWLDAAWEDEPSPGKPRRHLYRLTAAGAERAALIEVPAQDGIAPGPVSMRGERAT